ncbi:ParB/RepB/Spo0J family partition protein [uncultured Alsobacter sp.]|uniref:ParB/RepB/Spo0J family partition protein n=1 Tax=uncultured Alsobacter sp. TaxID=1748258 RepID=UPI0025D98110|nr:ParB/RepB/Spo0J family partition protein [uncultured Alsobacter sp.]
MLKRIALTQIVPNADQPRKLFDGKALAELANSIQTNGLMQPITVRPLGDDRYEIVMGERRWRAHRLLAEQGIEGFDTVLCHVKRMDDVERDVQAIVENLARADVTPMEEARAYQRMLDNGMTLEDLAKRIGVQPYRITDRTQLLKLSPELLQLFEKGQLERIYAYEISRLPTARDQMRIFQMLRQGKVSGWQAVKAAVNTVLDGSSQEDIFGETAPRASEEDVAKVGVMEARIDRITAALAGGWKDGECIVATKVSPDRARTMADKLAALSRTIRIMERDLRMASAQGDIVLEAAE